MATYTYTSNVPQASQKISATQSPIQNNFQAIAELINVNHVGFNDPVNFGKHTYLSLPFQVSDPLTTANQMVLYCKQTPSGPNAAEIYYRYPSNGSIEQLIGGSSSGVATNGYASMSSTVMIKWGTATGILGGSTNIITFPTVGGIPAFTATPYSIYVSPAVNYSQVSGSVYVSASTTTQFTLQVNAVSFATSVYWIAIGAS